MNHAVLREAELVLTGNVNLTALFRKMSEERLEDVEESLADTQVTPLKQK